MSRRVVVTGMGAISPIGNDVPTMWKNMVDGVCGIETITAFDTSDLKVHIAGTVKDFDPTQYIEKKEVRKLDPYTQYAIAAAQQAVDDSGIIGKIDENRFGVYIGAGIGGLQTFVKNTVGMENGGPRKVSPFFIPMMIGNIATGNVAIRFNAKGVSLSVMSACATGTNSIGEAFHCIKDGYADAIIAGGAEAVVAPLTIAGFQNMKALSTNDDPKHASRPFDKNRDGFIMGEGAGCLILEELEQLQEVLRFMQSFQAMAILVTHIMLQLPILTVQVLQEQLRLLLRRQMLPMTHSFTSMLTAQAHILTTLPKQWLSRRLSVKRLMMQISAQQNQ